jgi:hypothetical protein
MWTKSEALQQWFSDLAGDASYQKLAGMIPYYSGSKSEAIDM